MKRRLSLWAVRGVAVLTAVMGMVNVLSGANPGLHPRLVLLRGVLPLEVLHGARLASVLAGFALVLVAIGLWRRKRIAWGITVGLCIVTAITHLVKGLDWEEATGATVLALILLVLRRRFVAHSDRPALSWGVITTAFAFLFTLAYGVLGFYLLDIHFKQRFGLRDALYQTIAMFTQFSDPGLEPVTRFGFWFADSIYFVAATTIGFGLLSLLRPVLHRASTKPDERARAKTIIEAHGRSSLARFNLFDDKSYLFTPGGSVIAYGVSGRVCVALGDPVGTAADAPAAIAYFKTMCETNDWTPAFFQTLPDLLPAYKAAGFKAFGIGSEAVVNLSEFTLTGKPSKTLRNAVTRLEREGVSTQIVYPPHSPALMRELREVSDEWLAEQKGAEKQFSLGWHDEEYLQDGALAVVRDSSGALVAFANIISEYQANESTIDLMRRRTDAPNGVMDLLFVTLFEWAKAQGFRAFNLGLSPLYGVGDAPGDPAIDRAVAFLKAHFEQFYSFTGLQRYKAKFRPRWEPRYIIYTHEAALPGVALAVIKLDNGDAPLWHFVRKGIESGAANRAAKPSPTGDTEAA